MRRHVMLGLVLAAAVFGCHGGPSPPVPLRAFALQDVQGLWGGQALWAREDGPVVIQLVGDDPRHRSGLWEKRYELELRTEQWAEVERLVGVHHFLALRLKERTVVPDTACPSIAVVTKAGTTNKVTKWGDKKEPDFDPLYDYLLRLCREAVNTGQPIQEGPYDWKWRPQGFEQP